MVCSKKLKGSTASLPELVMIIFALALGIVLFGIAGKFADKEVIGNYDGEVIEGEPDFVYGVLAELAQECWVKNDNGNAHNSDVCFSVSIKATDEINESVFNEFLDCDTLPNNYLNIETLNFDGCGGKDSVYWEIIHNDTDIKITYSAARRRIEILEADPMYIDEGCLLKCNEVCNDAKDKCDNEHSSCMGADCDSIHEECVKNAEEMHDICLFICNN